MELCGIKLAAAFRTDPSSEKNRASKEQTVESFFGAWELERDARPGFRSGLLLVIKQLIACGSIKQIRGFRVRVKFGCQAEGGVDCQLDLPQVAVLGLDDA